MEGSGHKKIPKLILSQLGDLPSLQVTNRASAGLLTCGSFYFPRLPMPFRPGGLRHSGSLRVSSPHTAAGPCRNHTGFPFGPEAGHRAPNLFGYVFYDMRSELCQPITHISFINFCLKRGNFEEGNFLFIVKYK